MVVALCKFTLSVRDVEFAIDECREALLPEDADDEQADVPSDSDLLAEPADAGVRFVEEADAVDRDGPDHLLGLGVQPEAVAAV